MTLQESDEIERLIDRKGLASVLGEIENICHAKASHVREVWQDRGLAQLWERASDAVGKVAKNATVRDLSRG